MTSSAKDRTIVNISFAVETGGSANPKEAIEQVREFVQQSTPNGWNLVNLTVRDPSYSSEMLHALTSGAN